jgi:hypothetical protein
VGSAVATRRRAWRFVDPVARRTSPETFASPRPLAAGGVMHHRGAVLATTEPCIRRGGVLRRFSSHGVRIAPVSAKSVRAPHVRRGRGGSALMTGPSRATGMGVRWWIGIRTRASAALGGKSSAASADQSGGHRLRSAASWYRLGASLTGQRPRHPGTPADDPSALGLLLAGDGPVRVRDPLAPAAGVREAAARAGFPALVLGPVPAAGPTGRDRLRRRLLSLQAHRRLLQDVHRTRDYQADGHK